MELWIARDKNGELFIYKMQPYLNKTGVRFVVNKDEPSVVGVFMELDSKLFPEITFENSPQKVEINLVKNV